MSEVNFSTNDSEFSASLRRYALATRISFADAIRRQARLVAINLGIQTQPLGDGTSAKQQGEGSVSRDIDRVYDTIPEVAGKIQKTGKTLNGIKRVKSAPQAVAAFVRLVRSGKNQQAKELLNSLQIEPYFTTDVGRFNSGSEHKRARAGSRKNVPKNTFIKLAATNPPPLKSYTKQIMNRVGIAKAGWASCAQLLGGTRGLPGWVTRHSRKQQLGTVNDKTSGDRSQYVQMTNRVPWIDKCLNPGQIQRALDIQRGKMNNAIKMALSKSR